LPLGSPNAPGLWRGLAQRWGRAVAQRTARAVVGVDPALAQGQTILQTGKEPHLFAKHQAAQRPVGTVCCPWEARGWSSHAGW